MTSPGINGQSGVFQLFKDGKKIFVDTVTRVSVNQEVNTNRHFYVGNPIPQIDQQMLGWTGSFEMHVNNAIIEEFMDEIITATMNGIGLPEHAFMLTELYANGSRSGYYYTQCYFKMNREQAGADQKITKTLEFQAAMRTKM